MTLPSAGPGGRANAEPAVASRTRAPRRGSLPTVSVVVASNGDRHTLQACLAALLAQSEGVRAEVVVARPTSASEVNVLAKLYPGISFVAGPADATLTQLRALGFSHASGDVVAITDDQCVPGPRWLDAIVRRAAHGSDNGGARAEESGSTRIAEWAPYLAAHDIEPSVSDADGSRTEPSRASSAAGDGVERRDGSPPSLLRWIRDALISTRGRRRHRA